MRYLGGKKRLAKRIASILDDHREEGQPFVDVFCGLLSVSVAMPNRGPAVANDGCAPLINMYDAWRKGWRPPGEVSEDLYLQLKEKQDPKDPLTAFAGFGLSWGGKWFGGYARAKVKTGTRSIPPSSYTGPTEPLNYAELSGRSLNKTLGQCGHVRFSCKSFYHVDTKDSLVYCDPVYRNTTKYGYFGFFAHTDFESCAQEWADSGAVVFVSEYAKQQETWEQVAEWPSKKNIAKATRTERLFLIHPSEK